MHRLIQAILLSGMLLLTACGGGSSGGGGSGTYAGTYSVSLRAGGTFVRGSGTYTATISGNSITVRFDDGTVFSGEVRRSGEFVTGSATGTVVGFVDGCTSGTVRFSIFPFKPGDGTFGGIIGGENIVCNGTRFEIFGTHNATRT
jgi:hypothetical protein